MDWSLISRIDWDIAFKAAGIIAGVLISFYQLRNFIPRSRSTIKIDLEILKLLDPSDPNYSILKANIDEDIRRTYRIKQPKGSKRYVHNRPALILGSIVVFVSSVVTLYLLKDGFTWWSLLPGYIGYIGIGIIAESFDDKSAGKTPSA